MTNACASTGHSMGRRVEPEILVLDDEIVGDERAELHASLDRAQEDSDTGRGMDAWEYLERRKLIERQPR